MYMEMSSRDSESRNSMVATIWLPISSSIGLCMNRMRCWYCTSGQALSKGSKDAVMQAEEATSKAKQAREAMDQATSRQAGPHQDIEDLHPLYPPVLGVPVGHLGHRLGHASCGLLGSCLPLLLPAARLRQAVPTWAVHVIVGRLWLGNQLIPAAGLYLAAPESCSCCLGRSREPCMTV